MYFYKCIYKLRFIFKEKNAILFPAIIPQDWLVASSSFWMEGVALPVVALFGIVGKFYLLLASSSKLWHVLASSSLLYSVPVECSQS